MLQLIHPFPYNPEPILHIKLLTVNGNGYASICSLPHIDIQFSLQNMCYVHTHKKIYQFVCIPW